MNAAVQTVLSDGETALLQEMRRAVPGATIHVFGVYDFFPYVHDFAFASDAPAAMISALHQSKALDCLRDERLRAAHLLPACGAKDDRTHLLLYHQTAATYIDWIIREIDAVNATLDAPVPRVREVDLISDDDRVCMHILVSPEWVPGLSKISVRGLQKKLRLATSYAVCEGDIGTPANPLLVVNVYFAMPSSAA